MASIVARTFTKSIRSVYAARIIVIQSRNCKITLLIVSVLIVLMSGGWVRDWKPGPPPKTEAERIAAAKKYNLIPEDYECYDEDMGTGDYPALPIVGQDARDPYEDFDYHYHRRNFGETVNIILINRIILTVLSSYTLITTFILQIDMTPILSPATPGKWIVWCRIIGN